MDLRPGSIAICVIALVAGCSGATTGPGGNPLQASLVVTPPPSATNVTRGDTIRVTFPMAVDSASCVQRFLVHQGDSTGPMVAGRMSFGAGYRQMMFIPDSMMMAHQTYFMQMRDSVMTYGGAPGGMGGGMGMGGGQMMLMTPPAGGTRMHDGAGWTFTTGS